GTHSAVLCSTHEPPPDDARRAREETTRGVELEDSAASARLMRWLAQAPLLRRRGNAACRSSSRGEIHDPEGARTVAPRRERHGVEACDPTAMALARRDAPHRTLALRRAPRADASRKPLRLRPRR